MRQSILEWTNEICGSQPLKNLKTFEVLFKQTISLRIF